jgi:hypothetical protein
MDVNEDVFFTGHNGKHLVRFVHILRLGNQHRHLGDEKRRGNLVGVVFR